ncbi:hypothetical protein [Wolinella succinogenes]|uniref:hypothetical protein n=1 Tax=Wolinella succinogenes TaxID=844 RepID=UPI001013D2B2|nr:hypothetical protein [Wolinella succinogenes]
MNEELCKESEEHFGFLLVLMRFLIENHGQVPLNSEVKVFKEFIAPMERASPKSSSAILKRDSTLVLARYWLASWALSGTF